MKYKHLNEYDRAYINAYLKIGKSIRWIAKSLSRSPSTISREIKRNGEDEDNGIIAHNKSVLRRKMSKSICIQKYNKFLSFLYDNFDKKIYGIQTLIEVAKKHRLFPNIPSHQSVYKWINLGILKIKKYQLLRSSNKYKRYSYFKHKNIKNFKKIPINLRNSSVKDRKEFGHWECDSVVQKRAGSIILTLVERKTRFAITIKSQSKNMIKNYELIKNEILKSKYIFKSITFDNGTEFNEMYKLKSKLNIDIYYCHPYAPYERGTNELWNGMFRRFFPKGTNFSFITEDQIYSITNLINNMPRKILNWRSSYEFIQSQN